MVQEGGLHWMQFAAGSEALDGRDRLALATRGEGQAGYHPSPVDVHGARTASAPVATLFRAGQAGLFAKRIKQGGTRFDRKRHTTSVDLQHDVELLGRRDCGRPGQACIVGPGWRRRQ
jgi:hypothetical protein